ncbi:LysR substrate-binding domain-containing protein [Methylobacillus gramineus]|uniref:LysR substrate-binding domain-containing protein n=1 Tax=Methylobacillus gramineus TaxID=755169 RepID=UPI0021F648DC|nr:LysR substrate-binding domain-containing protein [Methylobacillus gramineus]
MRCKLEYQLAGLGFGFLPDFIAEQYIESGALISKTVIEHRQKENVYLAWRSDGTGEGLRWWIERMKQPHQFDALKVSRVENFSYTISTAAN